METQIKTPESHPDHHTVGHYFGGYCNKESGTAIYFCDSYDPRIGYWLTNVADATDRKNVSEAAIGRTFHEAYDQGAHWYVQAWRVRVEKQPIPQQPLYRHLDGVRGAWMETENCG